MRKEVVGMQDKNVAAKYEEDILPKLKEFRNLLTSLNDLVKSNVDLQIIVDELLKRGEIKDNRKRKNGRNYNYSFWNSLNLFFKKRGEGLLGSQINVSKNEYLKIKKILEDAVNKMKENVSFVYIQYKNFIYTVVDKMQEEFILVSHDEKILIGEDALWNSIIYFDPNNGTKFISYLRGNIKRKIREVNNRRVIARIAGQVGQLLGIDDAVLTKKIVLIHRFVLTKYGDSIKQFIGSSSEMPSEKFDQIKKEVVKEYEIKPSVADVILGVIFKGVKNDLSLDADSRQDEGVLLDRLENLTTETPEDILIRTEGMKAIKKRLYTVAGGNKKKEEIVRSRFLRPKKTLEQIADMHGVSAERIRQLQNNIVRDYLKLKEE